MSILKVNSIEAATPGSEDYFLTRAWAAFASYPSVSITQDGNVSTITDNGVGHFTVNFASSLPDVGYAVTGTTIGANFGSGLDGVVIRPDVQVTYPNPVMSSSSVTIQVGGSGLADEYYNSVNIVR